MNEYFSNPPKNVNFNQTYTTPVKCNIRIRNQPYQAIIDSGASVSMISYEIIKNLGLKIDTFLTSLIVSTTGPSVRP